MKEQFALIWFNMLLISHPASLYLARLGNMALNSSKKRLFGSNFYYVF